MVADNDAGGISTYAVTGSKFGFSLLWMFIILLPMAYYVQEMTVRLGAVTKRGHAEAIFDGFGPFWGWFSLIDLTIVNWLTLITEYVGNDGSDEPFRGTAIADRHCDYSNSFYCDRFRSVLDL